ncbi:MAG: hypothetical protein AAFN81_22435 [Bacteroidota bacterium]
MNRQIENIASWFLAVLMLIFGLNKFLGFIPVAPPADPTAQAFMGAMFTTYLFVVVALAEIIGGLLLLVPRFRFVAWLLLLPVVFNIVAFHIAHDFIGNGIWLVPTAVFVALGYFQLDRIVGLFSTEPTAIISQP